jgi:integrase
MARKRPAGESSIHFSERDKRWHGYVTVGTKPNGKLDRRHVAARTQADCLAKMRAFEVARDSGQVIAAGKGTLVSEWLDHWRANIAADRVRPRTLESYESLIRLYLIPQLGAIRIDKLKPEDLERAYKALRDAGLSPATVLRAHRVLSRAIKVAHQRGLVTRNVALLVEPPTVKRAETKLPFTAEEARAVLNTAQGARNGARWTVALAVGLRQSEALGLQWCDLNLLTGTLSVQRGLHRVKGQGLVYEAPKADRSRRTLHLPQPLVEALKEHRKAQQKERLAAGPLWEDHDLVFAQTNGRPIDKKADWLAWKALLVAAKVRNIRLHDARHTAATLLLSAGVHPRVVMDLLGHSQMRTTTDTYSHVMPALAKEAADKLGETLWG